MVAGINSALVALKISKEFILDRKNSYIGVMIDDLTSLGTNEPYRMLTSRAEYRLHLRSDNADLRLTELGIEIGVVNKTRKDVFFERQQKIINATNQLKLLTISPKKLQGFGVNIKQDGVVRNAYELLSFPEISFLVLEKIWPEIFFVNNLEKDLTKENSQFDQITKKQIAIEALYSAYLERQQRDIELFYKEENMKIPLQINYNKINSLSNEVREKLTKFRPATIGCAMKIQGITPASVIAIIIYLKNNFVNDNINNNEDQTTKIHKLS